MNQVRTRMRGRVARSSMRREEALKILGLKRSAPPVRIIRTYRALSRPFKRQLLQATTATGKKEHKDELRTLVRARDAALGERLVELLDKNPGRRLTLARARRLLGCKRKAPNTEVESAHDLCQRVLSRRFAQSSDDDEMAAIRRATRELHRVRQHAMVAEPPAPAPVVVETRVPETAEGEEPELFLAPLRARVVAFVVDYILIYILARGVSSPRFPLFFVILFVLYHALTLWWAARTPGKALMGLRVVRPHGKPITLLWALGRTGIGYFIVDVLGPGLLTALFDKRWRRTLHDYVFGGAVVSDGLEKATLKVWTRRLVEYAERLEEAHARTQARLLAAVGLTTASKFKGLWEFLGKMVPWALAIAVFLDKLVTVLYGADEKLKIASGIAGAGGAIGAALGAAGSGAAVVAVPTGLGLGGAAAATALTGAVTGTTLANVPGARDMFKKLLSPHHTLEYAGVVPESTFDNGAEAWVIARERGGTTPVYMPTGGNPGGYIRFHETAEPEKKALDLVLVVDGTSSMKNPLKRVRNWAQQTVKTIRENKRVALRLGLVCYRDVDAEVIERFDLDEDLDTQLIRFAKFEAVGGGDDEEAMYAGIHAASTMSWRDSDKAVRAMIVIGDAPAKDPDHEGNTLKSARKFIENSVGERFYVVDVGQTQTDALVDLVKGRSFVDTKDAKVADALTEILDRALADALYWKAPPKFLRNLEHAYARTLAFDLKHSCDSQERFPASDIVLVGDGLTLARQLPYSLGDDDVWTAFSIPLDEEGWRVRGGKERAPSADEMRRVLATLRGLWIRADFHEDLEENGLDNVSVRERRD